MRVSAIPALAKLAEAAEGADFQETLHSHLPRHQQRLSEIFADSSAAFSITGLRSKNGE